MTTDETTSSEKNDPAPLTLSEGQKLAGCYVLKARVSGSPAGDIWQAHDEVLGKDISLQFVPDKVRHDSQALSDLRREIKRSRQMIHPNILRVYDFIEEPDWAAVSMDAFEGESLESVLARKEHRILPLAEIESWFPQLCETLDDAHKIGLVHRNLSPSSIYFRPGGGIFLTGFGFSRCVSDAVRKADGAQGPESARISPQIMDGEPPNRLDDVYACGTLLYELLTGAPPLAGDNLGEQIHKAVPKPVNESRPKDLEPVPQSWEKAIAASLSKNPADRPASAGALARLMVAPPASEAAEPAGVMVPEAATASLAPAAALSPVAEAAREHKDGEKVKEPADPSKAPLEQGTPPYRKRSISTTGEAAAMGSFASKTTEKTPAAETNSPSTQERSARPKQARPDPYPSIYGNRSNFPALPFAIAIGLIVVGYLGYHFFARHKTESNGLSSENTGTEQTTGGVAPSASGPGNEAEQPPDKGPGSTAETPGVAAKSPTPSGSKPPTATVSAPLPGSATPKPAPGSPSASPAERALAEKQSALEAAKLSVRAAEKSLAELTAAQQKVAADAAAAQKALDDRTKALAPAKKTIEELLAKRKKLEDDQKNAEASALQAQQAAEEKQRLAALAKQAVEDMTAKNKDKLADLDKADAELAALKKALEEKQQAAAQGTKALADADAARRKQLDAVAASEKDVAAAQAAITNEEKNRLAREEQKKELDQQVLALQKLMDEKLKEIELKRKQLESGVIEPAPLATPAPTPVKSSGKATPPPRTSSVPVPPATPPEIAPLPKPAPPEPPKVALQGGPSVELNTPPPETQPSTAGGDSNSLGQRFVPVGDVEFCIWQTRVKDFDEFAKSVNLKSSGWRSPGFKQGPDHPVVNVSWIEAIAFCKWLTDKEHKEGVLPPHQYYRLPTDLEWSKAVGLPEETGKTPSDRDMVITDVYPWGKEWPPPPGAGNYTGEETASDVAIKGYNDGFVWTSPVGSFKPNKFGLYDMGGNVWQWCMDSWDAVSKGKVLRGASWYNGALKLSLLSSCRVHAAPDSSTDNYGFRIVRATDASRSAKK